MDTRWIDLEGAVNVRDIGGLPIAGGGSTTYDRLLRADNLQDLSPADTRWLVDDLGVTDVVDLRSDSERRIEGEPPLMANGVTHHELSLIFESDPGDTAREALVLPWSKRSATRKPEDELTELERAVGPYGRYLLDKPASVAAALEIVADAPGAVIVHCAAGKDRTGTIVALALDVAGVDAETIATEYALSAQRIERIIDRLGKRPAYAEAMEGVTIAQHTPRPERMIHFLGALHEHWGGAAGWLVEQGWPDAKIEHLRDRLTA